MRPRRWARSPTDPPVSRQSWLRGPGATTTRSAFIGAPRDTASAQRQTLPRVDASRNRTRRSAHPAATSLPRGSGSERDPPRFGASTAASATTPTLHARRDRRARRHPSLTRRAVTCASLTTYTAVKVPAPARPAHLTTDRKFEGCFTHAKFRECPSHAKEIRHSWNARDLRGVQRSGPGDRTGSRRGVLLNRGVIPSPHRSAGWRGLIGLKG